MANNFEAAAFALQCAFPKNKILMDDKGMPSVFVWIPAFRLCDVLDHHQHLYSPWHSV